MAYRQIGTLSRWASTSKLGAVSGAGPLTRTARLPSATRTLLSSTYPSCVQRQRLSTFSSTSSSSPAQFQGSRHLSTAPKPATTVDVAAVLARLGLSTTEPNAGLYSDGKWGGSGEVYTSVNPATGETLAQIKQATPEETTEAIAKARKAYIAFRDTTAPFRGQVLREIREALAAKLDDLGTLVSLEMGKILTEGRGEVQEGVDILDQAVGLSRSFGGTIVPSERPKHFLTEVHNPLGVVGVISAFNFPHAVAFWNFSLSFVTGNATIWKPAQTTMLVAIASTRIIAEVLERNGLDGSLASLVSGGGDIGAKLVSDKRVDLVSFTGSEERGRLVGMEVAGRFGQTLLELGGNNAAIVLPDANIPLALRTITFAALGTAGQRCTTTRRLFLHSSIATSFTESLVKAYKSASERVGNPLTSGTLIGPLHNQHAVTQYEKAIAEAKEQGGKVLIGGSRHVPKDSLLQGGNWVEPAIVFFEDASKAEVMKRETFAPILYISTFETMEEAIAMNNDVPQGLSSALFTQDFSTAFQWIGPSGSDTGIVNVNQSTSGAETGAPFGGNKSTGWGRESGGTAWKAYCRQASCTLNWSNEVALAQGVSFD